MYINNRLNKIFIRRLNLANFHNKYIYVCSSWREFRIQSQSSTVYFEWVTSDRKSPEEDNEYADNDDYAGDAPLDQDQGSRSDIEKGRDHRTQRSKRESKPVNVF